MKYCPNCGAQAESNQAVCLNCGHALNPTTSVSSSGTVDTGGFGWGLLGFCIPLIGLILFLVWRTDRPKTSKAAGLGALIGVISYFVFVIIYVVIIIAIIGSIDFDALALLPFFK